MYEQYEAHLVTPAWFDGDTPNDLHPIGVVIDPRLRHVEVPRTIGAVVTNVGVGDGPLMIPGRAHNERSWYAEVGDILLLFNVRMPTLRELWRD